MSESQTLLSEVNYIKNKVDTIERIEMLNLRSNSALKDMYLELFKNDSALFKVYKSVDGKKNQHAIAEDAAVSEMTVSRKIQILRENALVEVKEVVGKMTL